MRPVLYILCFLFSSVTPLAQQASDYFPDQTGFMWNYKATPLDSLNNPIDPLAFFRQDSFAVTTNYEGKLANIVLTKSDSLQAILQEPYEDSLFFHFSGTDGYEYFRVGALEFFLVYADSILADTNFSFVDFFYSLKDWYPVYRFDANVNQEYTLRSIDITITSISPLPLRFEYLGKRLDDETINTEIGNFDCKKFQISWKVSVVFPPPIGAVELLSTENTFWIAEDNWVVRDFIPTNHIDISFFLPEIEPFSIPGLKTEIIDEIVSVEETPNIPNIITLYQNYPNPFNPTTSIQYAVSSRQFVSLKVYDVLGNEVATLVNSEKPVGVYKVEWNATGIPSGVYFYQLQTEGYVETKKMVLLR